MAKVGGGNVVDLGADVTAPSTAIFEEGDEGVDVGTAADYGLCDGRDKKEREDTMWKNQCENKKAN
jgi:hypothetical protein